MEIMQEAVSFPLPETAEPVARRSNTARRKLKDNLARRGLWLVAVALLALIAAIAGLLIWRTSPILAAYPIGDLLTGQVWQPINGLFGFAPFIVGSFAVTGVAMSLAVIPAILSGIYLAEYTSAGRRARLKPLLDLLVGIPSVVYGLWGILFVVPLIRDHIGPFSDATIGRVLPIFSQTNPSGYGLLAGGIVLGIMVFPLIVAITDEVLRAIPREMREATLSLGATRWEATWCVVRHGAPEGIVAAVVLGFSRAFGETLAVMMVVGNTAAMPHSLFDTAYPLPALIANAYGEMMSVPLYQSALMGAALLLLVIVLIFNVLARQVIVRLGQKG